MHFDLRTCFTCRGLKLKSQYGWAVYDDQNGNGTNDVGFSAIPAGVAKYNVEQACAVYEGLDFSTYFWTTSDRSSTDARYLKIDNYHLTETEKMNKTSGLSVRCIQD